MAKNKPEYEVGKTLRSYKPAPVVQPNATAPIVSSPKKPFSFRKAIAVFLVSIFALLLIIGVWDSINISRAIKSSFGSGNIFSLLNPTRLKQQHGRVNLLLVGYSVDDPGHPGASLTDSIMLLSINTSTHKGYMLSIPRDLYVKIPGNGYGKINEAYKDGGIDTLTKIVSDNFNVTINYYSLINYAAVRSTVNAIGGITLNIKSPDPKGLYDPNISPVDGGPLKLSNGTQKLDGQTALNLTRARGDAYGSYGFPQADFDRTEHQRQVLVAIKQKLSWRLALDPLTNGKVLTAIGSNVKTNLQAHEARAFFGLLNKTPPESLSSYSLRDLNGKNYLTSYYSDYAGSALIPTAGIGEYQDIDEALAQLNQ